MEFGATEECRTCILCLEDFSKSDMGSILVRAIFTAKVVDNKSIPQLLSAILKEVRFLPDGNIQAVYKNGIADAEWNDSDLNLAMYRMGEQENQIKLFKSVANNGYDYVSYNFKSSIGNIFCRH